MKQLITVGTDGSLTSLLTKRGRGLDIKQLGEAEVVRSSEIEWEDSAKGWWIHLLNCKLHQGIVNRDMVEVAGAEAMDMVAGLECWQMGAGGECAIHFRDYDEAVTVEVAVIQGLRKRFGKDFA